MPPDRLWTLGVIPGASTNTSLGGPAATQPTMGACSTFTSAIRPEAVSGAFASLMAGTTRLHTRTSTATGDMRHGKDFVSKPRLAHPRGGRLASPKATGNHCNEK